MSQFFQLLGIFVTGCHKELLHLLHTFYVVVYIKNNTLCAQGYALRVSENMRIVMEPAIAGLCKHSVFYVKIHILLASFKNLYSCMFHAFSVLRIEEVQLDDLLTPEHYNVFMFESTLPRHYFDDATYNYHHQVLVDSPGLKFTPQLTEDSRLLPPRYFSYSGKVIGVFTIPACYCTSSYMSGFLKGILPISVMGINDKFTFRCICTHHSQPQLAPFLTYIKNNIISK